MINGTFDVDEINLLILALQAQGVSYLMGTAPSSRREEEAIEPIRLLQRLATCNFPIVEHATISLLLLHPELASSVSIALSESEQNLAENIAVITLAALYLQHWWFSRLAIAFGKLPSFPEEPFAFLWEDRQLPPPSSGYGRDGFLALQDYQQHRYGLPINFLDDWQNQIDHLLNQEEAYQRPFSEELREALLQHNAREGSNL